MAWTARILNVTSTGDALRAVVEVGFYEKSDPRNQPLPTIFMMRRAYASENLTDVPAFLALLDADGAKARTEYQKAQAVIAALPIGAEHTIP